MRSNKNAPRSREALCVSRVTFYSVTSVHAPIPHGSPGGSGSHGHVEVNQFHIERYSMPVNGLSQEVQGHLLRLTRGF